MGAKLGSGPQGSTRPPEPGASSRLPGQVGKPAIPRATGNTFDVRGWRLVPTARRSRSADHSPRSQGGPRGSSVHWRPGSYLARHARCAIAIPAVGTMARHALRAAKSKAQPSISKQRSGFCQPHVIYSQGGLANRVLLDQCLLLACPASGHPSSGGCLCCVPRARPSATGARAVRKRRSQR